MTMIALTPPPPHTHTQTNVCLSSTNESWEWNKSRLDKYTNTGECFDLCHTHRQYEKNRQVANICTGVPFLRRDNYPQVANMSQIRL